VNNCWTAWFARNEQSLRLARFDRVASQALVREMDAVVRAGDLMDFLTVALVRMAQNGTPLIPCPTEGRPWNDNDSLTDLDRSRDKIFPRILEAQRTRAARETTPS